MRHQQQSISLPAGSSVSHTFLHSHQVRKSLVYLASSLNPTHKHPSCEITWFSFFTCVMTFAYPIYLHFLYFTCVLFSPVPVLLSISQISSIFDKLAYGLKNDSCCALCKMKIGAWDWYIEKTFFLQIIVQLQTAISIHLTLDMLWRGSLFPGGTSPLLPCQCIHHSLLSLPHPLSSYDLLCGKELLRQFIVKWIHFFIHNTIFLYICIQAKKIFILINVMALFLHCYFG